MNILIVGYGFVGKSVEYSLTHKSSKHFNIKIYDPYQGLEDISGWEKMDAIFICVPTPPDSSGYCDYSTVEFYVRLFRESTCPVIIKSTVVPSGIEKLVNMNSKVVFIPEFLTEKNWELDVEQTEYYVIGTNDDDLYNSVSEIFRKSAFRGMFIKVSPIEASLFKYAANSFLATKVVFMHEMFKWLKDTGQDKHWETLISLLALDRRIGRTHLKAPGDHGLGFSGSCFPKDALALVNEARGSLPLLESVIERNKSLRKWNK